VASGSASTTPVDAELRPFGADYSATYRRLCAATDNTEVPASYSSGRATPSVQPSVNGGAIRCRRRDGWWISGTRADRRGLRFEAARTQLEQRVSEQMIGMRASVRWAHCALSGFVLGEAERPGSYTVSGLSTITNALFASGGVKPIGSLRNIELKRSGNVVQRLDLYDLLLKGDTSNDSRCCRGT
jgi:hypothetical protein